MTKLKSKTDFREMTNLYTKWVARPNRLSNSTKIIQLNIQPANVKPKLWII